MIQINENFGFHSLQIQKENFIVMVALFGFVINLKFFQLDFWLCLFYDYLLYLLINSHIQGFSEDLYGTPNEKIAMALIAESVLISFKKFYYCYKRTDWFFFIPWGEIEIKEEVNISPNMFSLLVTMGYALSLKVRNNIHIISKPKYIILHLLDILFFSSLISVFASNKYIKLPLYGDTKFTSQTFCTLLLVFSWMGIKAINIFIFPVVAYLSLSRIGEVNKAMGEFGIFYLLFSYTSIILQIADYEKLNGGFQNFFNELRNEYGFPYLNQTPLDLETIKEIGRSLGYEVIRRVEGQVINIGLKTPNGRKYDIQINENETIKNLKKNFREKYNVSGEIILVFSGKILDDNGIISHYGIKDGYVIIILIRGANN